MFGLNIKIKLLQKNYIFGENRNFAEINIKCIKFTKFLKNQKFFLNFLSIRNTK